MTRAARATAAAFAIALAVALTGCAAPAPAWSAVPLPGDVAVETLTAYGDELLVGTRTTTGVPAPGLVRLRGADATSLTVTPATGYGHEARWLSVAVDAAGGLVAVGGQRGGAHANVRWTVWRGNARTGLTEEEQTFETFGGWGAGELVGAVAAAAGPAVVGSWESRQAALDAAVWLPTGTRWIRQDSAGTPLESTAQALVGPVAATADGARILVVGSVVRLGDGSVRRQPAVWRSAGGASGWSRVDLPDAGSSGEASVALCRPGTCVVVGRVDERVAVWRFDGAAQRLAGLPETVVGDQDRVPVAWEDDGVVLAVPTPGGSRLLRQRGSGWDTLPGPPGPVRSLAVVGGVAYAVAPDPGGVHRLWRARL